MSWGRVTRRVFLGSVAGASAWLDFRPNRLARLAFPDAGPDSVNPDAGPVGRSTVPITAPHNPNVPDITISVER